MSDEELSSVRGRKIAMIFQNPFLALDPLFTINYQVGETITNYFPSKTKIEKKEFIENIFKQVQLDDVFKIIKKSTHI